MHAPIRLSALLALVFTAARLVGGEDMPPPPASMKIPPAPVLAPADALKSFKIAPGFRIELVASEPLVTNPVAMTFDPQGRLWVVEMNAYMPNVEGKGEEEPIGTVAMLEDMDGDGKVDKRTVFLDGLRNPRAIAWIDGGVLVAEPPTVWQCRDTDNDGKCDQKTAVFTDYGDQKNVEHTANGLLRGIDNWIYNANYTWRFRYEAGTWSREKTIFRGQWGLTKDDSGRLYYNTNSDMLRVDLVPPNYLERNPNFKAYGTNVKAAETQDVYPIRVNPGVNRGYQKGTLRDDGTLARFTAVCGPGIYRGDGFPSDFVGSAFVCEPSANLVRCNTVSEQDGKLVARNRYDKAEFLASTDERFRPVNCYTGPDGALYILDLYHGILQHKIFITPFLARQVIERGLDKPLHLGRIYRVVHDKAAKRPRPRLDQAKGDELIGHLSHANGWWRDMAQQLLVERKGDGQVEALRKLATGGAKPLGRLHALWTLEGLAAVDAPTIAAGLKDKDHRVRAAAIRLAERSVQAVGPAAVAAQLAPLAGDADVRVRMQVALSLGMLADPAADAAIDTLLRADAGEPLVRDAVLSGLAGREMDLIATLSDKDAWKTERPGAAALFTALSGCVAGERRAERVGRLLATIAAEKPAQAWRQLALLEGIAALKPKGDTKGKQQIKPVQLKAAPAGWDEFVAGAKGKAKEHALVVAELVVWSAPDPNAVVVADKPLSPEHQASFERGKLTYLGLCAACHQPTGLGLDGLAPPLVNSDWVLGSPQRLAGIVLHGLRGPIQVDGKTYNLEMPAVTILDAKALADVFTYVRREWGHSAAPIEAATVEAFGKAHADREEAWTAEELLKLP